MVEYGFSVSSHRTPAEAENLSEESDHSAKEQCLSNGDSCESIDGCMEFNISYIKAGGDEYFSNGVRRVTQLHDISGYTFAVDKASSLPKTAHGIDYLQAGDDDHLDIDYSGELLSGRHLRKVMSHPANGSKDGWFFGDDAPERNFDRSGSFPNEMFLTISDVSLRTRPSCLPPPSRPPPPLDGKEVDSGKAIPNCKSVASEESAGDSSPPYFDVEVDASSSAVASAAAMKEAMEKAQAKLKSAKESMERRREGFHMLSKSVSKNDRRDREEKVGTIDNASGSKKHERGQGTVKGGEENGVEHFILEKEESEKRLKENCEKKARRRWQKAAAEGEGNERRQKETCEREEIEKRRKEVLEREAYEKRLKEAEEKEENKRRLKETLEKEESQRRQRQAVEQEENAKREIEQNEKRLKQALEKEESRRRQKEAVEQEENERRLKENSDKKERLRWQKAGAEREENEKRQKEFCEREEIEKRQREVLEREAYEKRLKEVEEREENERRLKETLEKEERQRRHRQAVEQEENAKREIEQNEKRLKQALEKEESQRRQKEAVEQEEIANKEREENEKRLKKVREKEENERRWKAAVEKEQNEKKQREIHATEDVKQQSTTYEMGVSEIRLKEAFEKEETAERIKEACLREVGKRLDEVCGKAEKSITSGSLKEVEELEPGIREDHMEMKNANASESGNQASLNKMDEDYIEFDQACRFKNIEIHGTNQLGGNHDGNRKKMETTKETELTEWGNCKKEAVSGIVQGDLEHGERQFHMEDVTVTGQKINEKVTSKISADLETRNQITGFAFEGNGGRKNVEQTQVPLNQESNEVKFMSAGPLKEPVETGTKIKGTEPDRLEVKGNTQRTAQQVNASQSTERKVKNSYVTLPPEDKESENVKRERELERERLRKIEEEREREREREKDRMAVDRAALETRERAYAEARERAERAAVERATAEVRQRALNEARERLEKACAEAREKSFPDKVSIEARIRAERAAVERATAEARERAFEKAMAERATFEARERVERSVSDKFSASSWNSGIRPSSLSSEQQDLQSQGAGTFNGSRYQYSTVYSERYEGVEGESPQRCKARLERHRRTAERAAKALAEKNMRDLLAQREQAERNRFAETLDADVKRWSSGKEGNLRALLSTLQYILGPDSGWQPIPLTEVITAAAVKKAYRKATLCVHPDKLQQRGASIQQKYVCEKVFDLLKEAWSKFNSEER